ncbi:hypothetical protein Tco_0441964 [Tanacetum coccineum]
MSSYLFTLVMEVLTLMLHRRVRESDSFTYHRYCSDLNIINLCFANDFFLFVHGDAISARVIMDSLEEFKNVSGLTPSLPKSTAYFCNVLNYVKLDILSILPFEEGKLPVKYLGVPLVSSRLIFRDCTELVEKVRERILFILPSRIMMDREQLMRGFLWCQGEMRKGKAKVAWEVVCLPKIEGGLGIRHLEAFNTTLIINTNLNLFQCLLCLSQPDSHDRLFFECTFSLQVWNHIKAFAGLPRISSSLDDIVDSIISISKRRSARGIIAKLVFATSAYFIWQERNGRLFKNQKRSPNLVIECITSKVRLKLLTCTFKKTKNLMAFAHLWKLPDSINITVP